MQIFSIDTGFFKLDGGAMFGVVPKSIWNKENPADENNMCSWAMRCLLIIDGTRKILVDAGMGKKQSEKFFGYYYPHGDKNLISSLASYGFEPDEITDVILTHLHFDHCGGAVSMVNEALVLTFKNAIYWSNYTHLHNALHPNTRERASFLKENIVPIQESGQLKFIEELAGTRTYFTENISIQFVYGHTLSMMLPFINYKGKTIAYMADLIPSAAHIPIPYVMGYDMNPMTTLNEKEIFLNEAVEKDFILFFEHDPINECGTVMKTDRGFKKKDVFTLTQIK